MKNNRYENSHSCLDEEWSQLLFRNKRYNEYFDYFTTEVNIHAAEKNEHNTTNDNAKAEKDHDKKFKYLNYIGLREFFGEWGYELEYKKLPLLDIEDFPMSYKSDAIIYGIYRTVRKEIEKKLDCGNNKKLETLLIDRQRSFNNLGQLGSNIRNKYYGYFSTNEDDWKAPLWMLLISALIWFSFGKEIFRLALIPIIITVLVFSYFYTKWYKRHNFENDIDKEYKNYSSKKNNSIKQKYPFIYSTPKKQSETIIETTNPPSKPNLQSIGDSPMNETSNIKATEKITRKQKEDIITRTLGEEFKIDDDELNIIELSEEEGVLKEVKTKTYSRSRKNRDLALKIHGRTCIICNFNFDKTYGREISNGFIHIHHTKPLHKNGVNKPNIISDLVPVCSNCHSMVHRKKKELSIAELRKAISKNS